LQVKLMHLLKNLRKFRGIFKKSKILNINQDNA